MIKVLGFGLSSHAMGTRSKYALHHCEMLAVVVSLKKCAAHVQLEQYATD